MSLVLRTLLINCTVLLVLASVLAIAVLLAVGYHYGGGGDD